MFSPKVSIIVPVYNLEDYIERTVVSLLNQAYQNVEIILIDDGSKDTSFSIIKKLASLDSRIIYTTQPNGGAARARNTGLNIATGEFITYVDGDDKLSPNAISDNIGYFEDDKIDWVAFSIKRVDENGLYIKSKLMYNGLIFSQTEEISSKNFIPYFYEEKISGVVCGAIYRKKSIQNIRFEEGLFYEDSIYFVDLLCNTKYAILSSNGEYLYLERSDSSQKSQIDYDHLESSFYAINKRLSLYRELFPMYETYYKKDEKDYYYYLKNEFAKGNAIANLYIKKVRDNMRFSLRRNLLIEFKFILYRVIGYNRIKRILDILKV